MNLEQKLTEESLKILSDYYKLAIDSNLIQFQKTRKDFEGDITLVVFPLARIAKKSPVAAGNEIGELLVSKIDFIISFNTIQGFLNLVVSDLFWISELNRVESESDFGKQEKKNSRLMVEYSSPNTNKPLHLGHLRNNFLGHSVARILEANGYDVVKTQIINDRGIHICKSMLAWQRFGNGETPESSGIKGDKLVGKYYVEFDKKLKKETAVIIENWANRKFDCDEATIIEYNRLSSALKAKEDDKSRKGLEDKIKKLANNVTPIMQDVQSMLVKWEAKDPVVYELWKKLNGWVYDGFAQTYDSMGVDFDKLYYESETYLSGKEIVEVGLEKGVFYEKEDNSVWIDLTDEGFDEKLVLRGDGTAVYVTQDIGTANQRMLDFPDLNGIVYTVGNEQDYHFDVLFLILKKLGYKWADNCFHLSYGMIDLRNDKGEVGKMKSREGTVVDADDLISEVIGMTREMTKERGHIEGMSDTEKQDLYRIIGLGGLKYYLLKVDPTKRMTFNPDESVELNGNTGPFIQYVYARISSLLRSAEMELTMPEDIDFELLSVERDLIIKLVDYPNVVIQAGTDYSPALIANYIFELGKTFNSLWQNVSILKEENTAKKQMRLVLSKNVAKVIKSGMYLLGIGVPLRM